MKSISIREPWAFLIAIGLKDIENRSWQTKYRGRIYIHASAAYDGEAWKALYQTGVLSLGSALVIESVLKRMNLMGAIIGEVDIVDCVEHSGSKWFSGPYGFVLKNASIYDKPIPYKGRLGLFEVPDLEGK